MGETLGNLSAFYAMFPGNGKFDVFPLWLAENHHARLSSIYAPSIRHIHSEDLDSEYLNVFETRTRTPFFQDSYVNGMRVNLTLGPTGSEKGISTVRDHQPARPHHHRVPREPPRCRSAGERHCTSRAAESTGNDACSGTRFSGAERRCAVSYELILPFFPEELRALLLDTSISDLMINGTSGVYADRAGVMQPVKLLESYTNARLDCRHRARRACAGTGPHDAEPDPEHASAGRLACGRGRPARLHRWTDVHHPEVQQVVHLGRTGGERKPAPACA